MIDTIVLYINNIDKYPSIYEKFYNPNQKQNSSTTALINEELATSLKNREIVANIYHDYNSVLPLTHRNNLIVPSSHYTLSYLLNTNKKRLEFNFSIPKYLYATNVLQFINLYAQDAYHTYFELIKFILSFLRDNFIQEPLLEDVQIARIDFCYNQFFNSKGDALAYLDKQKNLLAKYARTSRNRYRSYDTSLMYVTDRYSFKIYHKGSEFKQHDYYELSNNGNKYGYDIEWLQEQADCILRYEMTFRSSMMDYLAKQNLYRSKKSEESPRYEGHQIFQFLKKCVLSLSNSQYTKNRKDALRKFVGCQWQFTLKSPFESITVTDLLLESKSITFDKDIFEMLYDRFWAEVKKYQLDQSVSYYTILDRIKKHNEDNEVKNKLRSRKKHGINPTTVIMAAMLSQHLPLTELKNNGVIPRRTFYDLKKKLDEIGVSVDGSTDMCVNPSLDYSDYKIYFKNLIHHATFV